MERFKIIFSWPVNSSTFNSAVCGSLFPPLIIIYSSHISYSVVLPCRHAEHSRAQGRERTAKFTDSRQTYTHAHTYLSTGWMENAPEKLTLLLDNLCAADEAAKSGNLTSNLLRDVSCGIEEDLFPSLEVGELEEMLSAIDLHVGDFKAEHTPAEPKDGLRIAEPTCDDVDRVCSKMDVERSRSVIGERPLSDLRIPPTEETTAERSQKTGGGHFMPMFEEQANYGLHQVCGPITNGVVDGMHVSLWSVGGLGATYVWRQ